MAHMGRGAYRYYRRMTNPVPQVQELATIPAAEVGTFVQRVIAIIKAWFGRVA